MRARFVVIIAVLILIAFGVAVLRGKYVDKVAQAPAASAAPVEASAAPVEASPEVSESPAEVPSAGESSAPVAETSPAESVSPGESTSPGAESSESPSPEPSIPSPPPGLPAGWEKQSDRVENGSEADLVVRTGAIDNLGFGWPAHFTPFSGNSTPVHPWICTSRPGSAPGTDRSELGTAVTLHDIQTRPADGYSGCSKRPDNLPQAIPLTIGTLPALHKVFFQIFLDDFQPKVFHSNFQVTLNGTRIPQFEDTINQLDQTGPIGKLVTLPLLPEYWPILNAGTVNLFIDDPTTGAPDGYAVNFVRVLVNPHGFEYNVSVACNIIDADTQKPIAKADCSAALVTASTDSKGNASLKGVPAGMVSVNASAVNYDSQVQLLDLPAGQHGVANFALKRHKENAVSEMKQELQRNGKVAIYGIHFDTASAKLRPDSIASLNSILTLVKSSPDSNWVIAGHTDNQGGAVYNLGLSQARAQSVVTWLEQHGVSAARLTAKGYGLTRPVADNSTESGRALNRRVEVSLQK